MLAVESDTPLGDEDAGLVPPYWITPKTRGLPEVFKVEAGKPCSQKLPAPPSSLYPTLRSAAVFTRKEVWCAGKRSLKTQGETSVYHLCTSLTLGTLLISLSGGSHICEMECIISLAGRAVYGEHGHSVNGTWSSRFLIPIPPEKKFQNTPSSA